MEISMQIKNNIDSVQIFRIAVVLFIQINVLI